MYGPVVTAEPPREVELKLLVAPADVPILRRHRRLRETAITRASTRLLRSVYYDTAGLDLLQRGVTLRLRRAGRRTLQTLKLPAASGGAGLLERTEFEADIRGERPDPSRIPDPALRLLVAELCGREDFGPILETEVRRTERRLRIDDTLLRFDLDQGEIRTPRGNAPICELELELEAGDPYQLYALAADLQHAVPLRISTRSKFERGIERLTGAQPPPRRARRLHLPADATLERAMEEALRGSFDQVLANEEPARRGIDPEGVHQMRVGVRRLRSAMALFRDVLPADQVEPLREDLRWLAGELGRARDLDVFVDERLAPLRRRFPEDPSLKRLHDEAAQMRGEAYGRVRDCLDSDRYAALMLRLGSWLAAREWRQQPTSPASARLFVPAREEARALLGRRYAKLRKRGRNLATKTEREKHALRIQAKKLRYATEFLRGLFAHAHAGRFIRATAGLQDTLGHLNDAATARALLGELLERLRAETHPELLRSAGFVEGWVSRAAVQELADLSERWRQLRRQAAFWDVQD